MKEEQTQQTTTDQQEQPQERKAVEKFWDATVDTWNSATFRANQYKRVVQKKIDLTSLHKKITSAHADLGKKIDDLHQQEAVDIMQHPDVVNMLNGLDSMRTAAAALEEEIVAIKNEEPPLDQSVPPPEGHA